ncbi:MAG: GGDEF domain-containing protein [Gemmatirosa sp.]|nr:GGDEF domain-containing protein [Gemmatirosa sp.]
MSHSPAIVLQRRARDLSPEVTRWIASLASEVLTVEDADALMARVLRSRPACVVLDARGDTTESVLSATARLKRDSFTGIVPAVVLADPSSEAVAAAFQAGADEVVVDSQAPAEIEARLAALMRRSERDTGVHPTTRLPGTVEIERELDRRIAAREPFATCYADLDHFKEFNDRYGYNEGDRVIRVLALVLHDVVKGVCGERGFVGHIGGDDFIFVVPLADMPTACDAIVETFEALVPIQYTEADRRAGYYFGKDRRGQLHRVPLMSVSIGVVTTERRQFTRAAQVSELASEMKTYAKAQAGSGYSVDRRQDALAGQPPATKRSAQEGA